MRRSDLLITALVVVALVVVGWNTSAKAETVTGRLVDLACYSTNKELTGNFHQGRGLICAQACAREGFPVGLLTDTKVYQIEGALAADLNAKLVPHMSHTVTITGDVSEKDGTTVITATDLKMVSAK
jgi:hypothetical protein